MILLPAPARAAPRSLKVEINPVTSGPLVVSDGVTMFSVLIWRRDWRPCIIARGFCEMIACQDHLTISSKFRGTGVDGSVDIRLAERGAPDRRRQLTVFTFHHAPWCGINSDISLAARDCAPPFQITPTHIIGSPIWCIGRAHPRRARRRADGSRSAPARSMLFPPERSAFT